MRVMSCRRQPAPKRGIPGSSPSNCEPRSAQRRPPPTRAAVESGEKAGRGSGSNGREDAQSQTQCDGGVAEMEQTGRGEGDGQ